jgi:hypothetical protein
VHVWRSDRYVFGGRTVRVGLSNTRLPDDCNPVTGGLLLNQGEIYNVFWIPVIC